MKEVYINLMNYLENNYPHEYDTMKFIEDCKSNNIPTEIKIAIQVYNYNYLDIIDDYLDFLAYVA